MDAADAFVGVVTADDKARDLAVDFAVEASKDGRREFWQCQWAGAGGGGLQSVVAVRAGCCSPRCAASTVCRRLCAPFCLMSSCLLPVSCQCCVCESCRVWELPHLERSSWTMRSSADDSALCCAILSASPEASGRREGQLQAFHRQEDAVLCLFGMY